MPRLPQITDREFIRVIKKLGFQEHSERGTSHLVFTHSDGRRTVVSRHPGKDIPRGLLRAMLRQIETPPQEFIDLLKN